MVPRAHHGGEWVPLEMPVLTAMLELARCTAEDSVWDLGCGDARALTVALLPPFSAASATGVELSAHTAALAAAHIEHALARPDVRARVRIIVGDAADPLLLANAGIASASVILLFVAPALMRALAPILRAHCAPTCRVVAATHAFDPVWPAFEQRVFEGAFAAGLRRTIRLWRVGDCPLST
ncbi:hypothetical protein KFE25_009290 [Diacronema lutheri]|uniref:Methyltransferase domain-containing protein n=1 Tax=Diacronema lutheri TaxID=2081491 RepID=A0A8J5Y4T9_DIALT|nr:hypothetical protein KFE25_009290 [Diacronema lutheri]